jgi:hypothetical protein
MPRSLGVSLRDCLLRRQISSGLEIIASATSQTNIANPELDLIDIEEIASWIDFDFDLRGWIEQKIKPFTEAREDLNYRQGLRLRFAEAAVDLHHERFDLAVQGFEEVIYHTIKCLDDPHLYLSANYYAARSRYYQTRYEDAGVFLDRAHDHAASLSSNGSLATATLNILRSRIVMKTKSPKEVVSEADSLLRGAWEAFVGTDDHITKGNILTFQAQIVKDSPHYGEDALVLLGKAIEEFRLHPRPGHPAEARTRLYRARLCGARLRRAMTM